MPQIPDFDPIQDVHQNFTPQASPQALAQPGRAIAAGGAQIGAEMEAFNQRYQEGRRADDLSNLMADAGKQLNDAYFKYSRMPDRVAAGDGFAQQSQAIYKGIAGRINDPQVTQHFTQAYNAESVSRQLETEHEAFGYETAKYKGNLRTNLFTFAQNAATANDPMLQGKIVDEGIKAINGAQAGGWLNGDEAAAERLKFASDIQKVKVEGLMNRALSSRNPADMQSVQQLLADPKNFVGLDPNVRPELDSRIDNKLYRLQFEANARQAHNDAMAERGLRQTQGHNEAVLLGGIYNGKTIDPVTLEKLADGGQISSSGLDTIHSALERQNEGHDDAATTLQLWHGIDTGKATIEDVYAAVHGGALRASTAADMTKALDAGSSPAAKDAAALLHKAITGSAFGGFGKGALEETAAEAQRVFRTRIGNGEPPAQALAEIVPQYAPSFTAGHFLDRPRFGTVASLKELQGVAAATVKAHDARQIDDATYDGQLELLKNYTRYFAAEDAAQQATKARAPSPAKGSGR